MIVKQEFLTGKLCEMNEWKEYKVGDLVRLKIISKPLDGNHGGIHPTSKDYVKYGIPFIMASDVMNGIVDLNDCKFITLEHSKKLKKGFAKEGDVLLTHKASIGRTAIVPSINVDYIVLTPQVTFYRVLDKEKLSNIFLRYYFTSSEFQNTLLTWSGSGSTRSYIGITEQLNLPVRIPPLATQTAIAEILSSLDDKIELNNQINRELEALAQALFKRWFVDFEFPDAKGVPYKSSGGAMVDSALGEIPLGWEVGTLGDMADVKGGKRMPLNTELTQLVTDHPYLRVRDFSNGKVDATNLMYVPDDVWPAIKNYTVSKKDIYITIVGTIGLVGLIPPFLDGANLTENAAKIISKNEVFFSKNYIYLHLKGSTGQDEINARTVGSTQPKLAIFRIREIPIIIPPNKSLFEFEKSIDSLIESIFANDQENLTLTNLRDTLLPKLISGEVEV